VSQLSERVGQVIQDSSEGEKREGFDSPEQFDIDAHHFGIAPELELEPERERVEGAGDKSRGERMKECKSLRFLHLEARGRGGGGGGRFEVGRGGSLRVRREDSRVGKTKVEVEA